MKKVVTGIVAMVMMVLMVANISSASEEVLYDVSSWTAIEKITEFAKSQGLDDWTIGNTVNGVIYGMGIVRAEDFERESGLKWSISNFEKWAKNSEYEIVDIYTRVVGMIDGINVYRMQAQSETKALATDEYGEPYYCIDALFLVYSNEKK